MAEQGFSVKLVGIEEVQKLIDELPESEFTAAKQIMESELSDALNKVRARLSGNPMKSRTGNLKESLGAEVKGSSLATLEASLFGLNRVAGGPVLYTRIHEFGGTITAKNAFKKLPGGPYLAIPSTYNQDSRGVMKKGVGDVMGGGGYIAQFKSGGWGVFFNGQLMFALKKSVRIPARLGMINASAEALDGIVRRLGELK